MQQGHVSALKKNHDCDGPVLQQSMGKQLTIFLSLPTPRPTHKFHVIEDGTHRDQTVPSNHRYHPMPLPPALAMIYQP